MTLDLVIGQHVIHARPFPSEFKHGKWVYATEERDVILLAVSGCHAMVRRPRCVPYVAPIKELVIPTKII